MTDKPDAAKDAGRTDAGTKRPLQKHTVSVSLPDDLTIAESQELRNALATTVTLNISSPSGAAFSASQVEVEQSIQALLATECQKVRPYITHTYAPMLKEIEQHAEAIQLRLQGENSADEIARMKAHAKDAHGEADFTHIIGSLNSIVQKHIATLGDGEYGALDFINCFRMERLYTLHNFAEQMTGFIPFPENAEGMVARLWRTAAAIARSAAKSTLSDAGACREAVKTFEQNAEIWAEIAEEVARTSEIERLKKVQEHSKCLLKFFEDRRLSLSIGMGYTGEDAFANAKVKLLAAWVKEVVTSLEKEESISNVSARCYSGTLSNGFAQGGYMVDPHDGIDDHLYISSDPQGVTLLIRHTFESLLRERIEKLTSVGMRLPSAIQVVTRINEDDERLDCESISYAGLLDATDAPGSAVFTINLSGIGLSKEI